VRAAAVGFFVNHPLPLAGEALLKTLADADPRIVEGVADALGEVRPPGAREALEKRRAGLEDPAALKAVDRALARLPR